MASLVASRYGERYASAPALSSGTLNAATPSYNTRSLHNNNRLGSNVQIGINHFNTIGGHRRYHTPVGSSSAELSIFSSDISTTPNGQRCQSNNESNSIRIITPGLHNSLDRRLFTRNNQNQTGRNHTLAMMRHHHHNGRNSSVSWQNQPSPHHQRQPPTTSPPLLTPSPSDSGFASGVENSANDLSATARGARGLTSTTPSGISVASVGSSRASNNNTNDATAAGSRVCRSSKIYINGDGEFISEEWSQGKNMTGVSLRRI
ncbi:uncharacterized protein LOC113384502 isoform X1 [Ctenocephalides felis]|uniref:uncharacterized protein LOC113384502 isoform X1 n=1 Tax=Ctenocephalides felis TaxID=7515 RepID=UPI000E6E37A5|nr:uncharacterized protein LOC113384502 isoform X1 [Ctenocephalides felis]